MEREETQFLISEYVNLWKDFGIDDLDRHPKKWQHVMDPETTPPVTQTGVSENPKLCSLQDVRQWIGDCRRCRLCEGRKNIVFGTGNPKASLLFVGEGPGADEDTEGAPFVGRAGQLLTKIIDAMGYTREQVYIANVVKCRPPNNRAPLPDEIANCLPFLKAQLRQIEPKLVVALGLYAANVLTGTTSTISSLRGRFHRLQWNSEISVMPTYHPAYLLRNPTAKKMVWEDMKLVKAKLEALQ